MLTVLLSLSLMILSPEQVVQKQLDTYNARNLEAFMSVMSDDVTLVNFKDQKTLASGHQQVKDIYANLFEKSPNLHSQVLNRMVLGHQVIDHERITGRMGSKETIELIVIYEVKNEKITKITILRP